MPERKAIIVSAPSGSGKTTIVKYLLERIPGLSFSVSATSRKSRAGEVDGKDYYFFSKEEFLDKIRNNEFVEWEEVYDGSYYGTLKSELDRIWSEGGNVIFDVDVQGALNLKKYFSEKGLAIFIRVKNLSVLETRLRQRGADNEESLSNRLLKARSEMNYEKYFDEVIVNDVLEVAKKQAEHLIQNFLNL